MPPYAATTSNGRIPQHSRRRLAATVSNAEAEASKFALLKYTAAATYTRASSGRALYFSAHP